ncbi:MAG: hypothetical protein HY775_01275 [Acidobacteria bacterium]|nr:hypothetical protein [Acidobacteriota bacterium]
MDKTFFESLRARAGEFGARASLGDDVRVEVRLHSGRGYVVDRVVEAGDSFVQFDGVDASDGEEPLSLVLPYHQVSHVILTRSKPKASSTGFGAH